jgi:hypothetical protein
VGIRQARQKRLGKRERPELGIVGQLGVAAAGRLDDDTEIAILGLDRQAGKIDHLSILFGRRH